MICQQISVVSTKQRQKKEGYFYIDQTSFIKECWECGSAFQEKKC